MFKKILIALILTLFLVLFIFPINVKALTKDSNIYLLGDSRFVGMSSFDESNNHLYYAKVGEGYNYLNKTWEDIKDLPTKDDYIIINFGVNDLSNIKEYIDFLNEIPEDTEAKVIFMTVNPVNEKVESKFGYKVKNKTIDKFNKQIAEDIESDVYIMNTNKYLTDNDFTTVDGLHFNKDTYQDILDYLNSYLDNFEE